MSRGGQVLTTGSTILPSPEALTRVPWPRQILPVALSIWKTCRPANVEVKTTGKLMNGVTWPWTVPLKALTIPRPPLLIRLYPPIIIIRSPPPPRTSRKTPTLRALTLWAVLSTRT